MQPPDDVVEILSALAESANDVFWTMSVAGEITYVSPSVERMRGLTPEEAMAQPLDEIMTPESTALTVKYFEDLYAALASGGQPPDNYWGEREYYCKDGSTVWTEVHAIPRYDDSGTLTEIFGVTRDISERKEQERLLQAARDEAAAARVAAERERAQQEERERMARDLHDDLLQTLATVRADIAVMGLSTNDPDGARTSLERSQQDLAQAIESARRLVTGLRPRALEGRGLMEALDSLALDFAARTGVDCEVACNANLDAPSAVTECLYRVAQESLANAGKHAEATAVRLELSRPQPDRLMLRVHDDGRGFAMGDQDNDGSFGLIGMRERVQLVGGTVRVESIAGSGTCVEAEVPTGT